MTLRTAWQQWANCLIGRVSRTGKNYVLPFKLWRYFQCGYGDTASRKISDLSYKTSKELLKTCLTILNWGLQIEKGRGFWFTSLLNLALSPTNYMIKQPEESHIPVTTSMRDCSPEWKPYLSHLLSHVTDSVNNQGLYLKTLCGNSYHSHIMYTDSHTHKVSVQSKARVEKSASLLTCKLE